MLLESLLLPNTFQLCPLHLGPQNQWIGAKIM